MIFLSPLSWSSRQRCQPRLPEHLHCFAQGWVYIVICWNCNTMNNNPSERYSGHIPHSCQHCSKIGMNGLRDINNFDKIFKVLFDEVQFFSSECKLFHSDLTLPVSDLEARVTLSLFKYGYRKNIHLNTQWYDSGSYSLPKYDYEHRLRIFVEEGILKFIINNRFSWRVQVL